MVEEHDRQQVRFTWLWRDPLGDERRSPIRRVYLDINGVTDHHSTEPSTLQRLAGTDIWHGSFLLPRDWRGSYSLIPVQDAQLPRFSAPIGRSAASSSAPGGSPFSRWRLPIR
ncbi:hypothetical protein GGER_23530 [Serratia rubidaea]